MVVAVILGTVLTTYVDDGMAGGEEGGISGS